MANWVLFKYFQQAAASFNVTLSIEVFIQRDRKSIRKLWIWGGRAILVNSLRAWSNEELNKELIWILRDSETERSNEEKSEEFEKSK